MDCVLFRLKQSLLILDTEQIPQIDDGVSKDVPDLKRPSKTINLVCFFKSPLSLEYLRKGTVTWYTQVCVEYGLVAGTA